MTILSKDVSVVIQGAIDWSVDERFLKATTYCLTQKVRELLPDAEIILSTWKDQRIAGLDFDRVLQSIDPGAQSEWPGFTPNNVNRQIRSTVAGLNIADRRYVLKIRTDMILTGTNFLDIYKQQLPIKKDKKAIFRRPIVTNNLSSRNTTSILAKLPNHPLLFHPSDHLHFGYIEDFRKLWDVDFQTDEDAFHFYDKTYPNRWRMHELSRLAPEQHILTNAISKNYKPIDLKTYGSYSEPLFELSEYYLSTHFKSIPDQQYPVRFAKYHSDHHASFFWMRRNDGEPDHFELGFDLDTVVDSGDAIIAKRPSLMKRLTFPFRRPKRFYERIRQGYYRR